MRRAGALDLLLALLPAGQRIGPPARPTEHPEGELCGGLCFAESCVEKAARAAGLLPVPDAASPPTPR